MEIIKTGVRNLDFSRMSLEEIRDYWKTLESDSLHQVLPSRLNLGYLCEVIEELERIKITKAEFENQKDYIQRLYAKEFLSRDEQDTIPQEWGAEPGWHCLSYSDITEINNPNLPDESDRTRIDYYSTPEVLEVLKQWKAYLEKFEAENKDRDE